MSGPSFRFRLPPASLFKFPPDPAPLAIPPPSKREAYSFAAPFPIDATLYNNALDWKVPTTVAALYVTMAVVMNAVNRRRGNKPWAFTKYRAFFYFVVLHNIVLATFSAVTFVALLRALRHTWPSYREYPRWGKMWPGIRTENGLAGAADALCKMNGPRGFGDAAYYDPITHLWDNKNKLINFAETGDPDSTDVGRIWNEGVAFWGWFFYLSKFYEVLDTAIILAKGKRSSSLQTYHHTGAMFCMWAGIRFMSPPIWMFCFFNSGVHALMYTYYTLSAFNVKVPRRVKMTLTNLQISQFLIGFTFACLHLFVEYTVPVTTTYTFVNTVKSAASAISSAAGSVTSELAQATARANTGAWVKKMLLRAAGEEGLAENVRDAQGNTFGPKPHHHIWKTINETRTRTQYETVPCIDTSGQAFAIWLNLLYLAPLTWLFVRFFIRAYKKRNTSGASKPKQISDAANDAAHSVDREVESLGKAAEDKALETSDKIAAKYPTERRRISETIQDSQRKIKSAFDGASTEAKTIGKKASQEFEQLRANGVASVKERADNLRKKSPSPKKANGRTPAEEGWDVLSEESGKIMDGAKEKASELVGGAKNKASKAKKAGKDKAQKTADKADETTDAAKQKTKDAKDDAEGKAKDVKDEAEDKAKDVKDEVESEAEDVKDEAEDVEHEAEDKTEDSTPKAKRQPKKSADPTESSDAPSSTGADDGGDTTDATSADGESFEPVEQVEPLKPADPEKLNTKGASSTDAES